MTRRQTAVPLRWMIINGENAARLPRRLPARTGLIVLGGSAELARTLRRRARSRRIPIVEEAKGKVARVHDLKELRSALRARVPLILLSPIYPTQSHPSWAPIPRMQAAAMARLGGRRLIALGGMDDARFRRIAPFGFQAWAGISGFRT